MLGAQQVDSALSAAAIESFARTHLAVAALRDRFQGELAAPKSKKEEVQRDLREQLHSQLQALLKENGFSEVEFARVTRLVSVDSSARREFEAAVARLEKR